MHILILAPEIPVSPSRMRFIVPELEWRNVDDTHAGTYARHMTSPTLYYFVGSTSPAWLSWSRSRTQPKSINYLEQLQHKRTMIPSIRRFQRITYKHHVLLTISKEAIPCIALWLNSASPAISSEHGLSSREDPFKTGRNVNQTPVHHKLSQVSICIRKSPASESQWLGTETCITTMSLT